MGLKKLLETTGMHFDLLSITNNKNTQPVKINNRYIIIYNGELYNHWDKYNKNYGDTDFLTNHINKYGIDGLKTLDGEYALIIYDNKLKIILVKRSFWN